LSQELVKVHVRKQTDDAEERRQYQIKKQEKHQTPSKVWMEKAANTDYEVSLLLLLVFSVLSQTQVSFFSLSLFSTFTFF
jgi:hypothetical protein